jgi:hypothetical protein
MTYVYLFFYPLIFSLHVTKLCLCFVCFLPSNLFHATKFQLQSEKMRDVVVTLQEAESAIEVQFSKVVEDVKKEQAVAKSNALYLGAAKPLFRKLRTDVDFPGLADVFRPLMHVL